MPSSRLLLCCGDTAPMLIAAAACRAPALPADI